MTIKTSYQLSRDALRASADGDYGLSAELWEAAANRESREDQKAVLMAMSRDMKNKDR